MIYKELPMLKQIIDALSIGRIAGLYKNIKGIDVYPLFLIRRNAPPTFPTFPNLQQIIKRST
jgi:hypothetical protein